MNEDLTSYREPVGMKGLLILLLLFLSSLGFLYLCVLAVVLLMDKIF